MSHRPRSAPPSTRRRLTLAAVAAVCAIAVSGLAVPAATAAPGNGKAKGTLVDINLVTVNDFHGRIEESGAAAGIARLSRAVDSFRHGNPNTLFAAAGDMIGASTFTSFIQEDVPTIEALNAAGLDVSAVGNHEFDRGFDDLTDRVMPLADWEYLGANVYDRSSGDPALPEYWVEEVGHGSKSVSVGFVGAVTDELPTLVSPAGIAGITVGSPVDAANRVADQLSDGNAANGEADIVVLLVHEGAVNTSIESATDETTRFGRIVLGANDNIDAIVSGHTHLAYNHVIDGRPVISSGQYGENFSNMEIVYDPRAEAIVSMRNTVYTMAVRDEEGDIVGYNYKPDKTVEPIVTEATAVAAELGGVELGEATALFGRAVDDDPATAESFPENRGGESTLGNFVADVQKWALNADQDRGVQITFMNPGGLRADLQSGAVTFAEAAAVQPFANTLVSMSLTGAQIEQVLEEQWQPEGASRPFLKLGVSDGFSYTYDPTAAQGARITRMWLAQADGTKVEIQPDAVYGVGVNSFLASGGDNFATLAEGTDTADSGRIDLEAMVDWFAEFTTAEPDLRQRAVGVHLPGGTSVQAGSQVSVDLSSLDFSRDETDADVAVVTVGGVSTAGVPLDTSYTLDSDEIGRATVAFTVPAGLSGPTEVGVTVPATGTTTSFVLNVTP